MSEQKQLDDDIYWMLTDGYTYQRCKKCGIAIWLSGCDSRYDEDADERIIICTKEMKE
tara:strand:- start:86 stop:259 length:174 start_codon:yes stop_codon:yes gene_type:complete